MPTWTLPKLTLDGDAAKPPSATPLPVAEIFSEEFDASDVTVNDPSDFHCWLEKTAR
jgi:hypothetical protein